MFLQRVEILRQKIQLYHFYSDPANNDILNFLDESLNQDIVVVKDFLRAEITGFATLIIDSMLEHKLIEYAFLKVLFEFDHKEYETIFFKALEENIKQYDFETIEKIALGFHCSQQSIMCFEWVYKWIQKKPVRNTNEYYELFKSLIKFHSLESYRTLCNESDKQRLARLLSHLPFYIDCFHGFAKVIISSYGNGLYLNSKEISAEDDIYAAAFDLPTKVLWVYAENPPDNNYELHDITGSLLCMVPANSSTAWRATFCSFPDTGDSIKWTIKFYDSNDPYKGYLIKAKDRDAYLCCNPYENFKYYVQSKNTVDKNLNVNFTWKFQLCTD